MLLFRVSFLISLDALLDQVSTPSWFLPRPDGRPKAHHTQKSVIVGG
jgi:hypothetical protein